MNRINPIYILILLSTITFILLFNVQIEEEKLTQSNNEISYFHKQLNEYTKLNKSNLTKNTIIEKVKSILEDELPQNLNLNVKTLKKHIEITIKNNKFETKRVILEAFYNSNLQIIQLSMDKSNLLIRVKL